MSAILENLPEPTVYVTPTGIFIEWHANGMNVEVRVLDTGTYVNIEDKKRTFYDYSGNDSSAAGRALSALCAMDIRGETP